MRALVCVASKHGSTLQVGQAIERRLAAHGLEVDLMSPEAVTSLEGYDVVVLGSALYANRMMPAMAAFTHRWGEALARLPAYLFTSGPLDPGPVDGIPLPRDARDLAAFIGAREAKLFAGSMAPAGLKATERAVMRMIGARGGDYRDFAQIEEWADAIARSTGQTA
ncbi:MAG: flavodoxin domain-containing protein [Micrococcales bacterium]|nr:flavodoxin domain-containing protein [Micrococcales bacterium]